MFLEVCWEIAIPSIPSILFHAGVVTSNDILSWKYIIPENIAITAPKESTKWKWIVNDG